MAKVLRLRKTGPASASWQEAIEEYLWFKQAQGLRDIAVKGHRDAIGLFFKRHLEAWAGSLESAISFV